MNKEEKLKDNSKLLKIVIIILFIAFFVLGISQCVNDAVKTTYAENDITENVEVNNKFIDKKINKVINYQYEGTESGIVPNTNGGTLTNIYVNTTLTHGQVYDIVLGLTQFSLDGYYLDFYIILGQTETIAFAIQREFIDNDHWVYSLGLQTADSYEVFWISNAGWTDFVLTLPINTNILALLELPSISVDNPCTLGSITMPTGMQNALLKDLISIEPFIPYTVSGGGITPNERYENPLFTIPSGYEKVTEIVFDINPSQTTYNVARVVVCGKLDFDTDNNDYYYDLFYGFACGGVKKEYEVDKATRLSNGIEDLFLNDRFLIQINISEQNSITFNLSYLQVNTTKLNINEEMQCNSSYPSNNFFNSKGLNSMLLTRNFIKNYYNDIGFENGRVYGYEQGLNDGNVEGYNQGYQEGYDTGYLEGDTAGYNRGFTDGEVQGHDLGYREGKVDGFNEGYFEGETVGLENGYNNGFNDGQKDTLANNGFRNIVNSIFNAPYNIFNGFLNFEIFGINLFNLLSFAFTTILIIFIIGVLIKR